jgi:hypothetical protein
MFSNWSGDLSGTENPTTVTVLSEMTVTAVFTNFADPALAPPQGLNVVEPNRQMVTVSWSANSESDLAGYVVYFGSASVENGDAPAYDQSIDVGLKTSRNIFALSGRMFFAVRAYDDEGQYSEYSSEVTRYVLGATPPGSLDSGESGAEAQGTIVPDGYWAHEPNRPLEVRNLPIGWTVRIFDTAGTRVRKFKNKFEEGITWKWDFHNDHGLVIARALYLVRVVDEQGSVKKSGKFLVQSTR